MPNRSKLRFQVSHVRFSIVFPVLLYAICNTVSLERLAKWFQHGDRLDYSGLSAYLLAGLCLFILIFPEEELRRLRLQAAEYDPAATGGRVATLCPRRRREA